MECPPLKSWGTSPCNPRPAGPPLKVSSKIGKVTLYSDRALVTRTATVGTELDAGEHTLLVEGLPRCMEKHSVQVRMECSSATLLGIRFQEQLVHCSAAEDSALQDLRQKQVEHQDSIELCKGKLELISALGKSMASVSRDKTFDKKAWSEFLEHHENQVRDVRMVQRAHERELEIIKRKIAKPLPVPHREEQALISVKLSEPAVLQLSLAYIVPGTSWKPVYDLRANTASGVLELTYSAMVSQGSSEDWTDIALELSTSQPDEGGSHRELVQWRLSTKPQHGVLPIPTTQPPMSNIPSPLSDPFELREMQGQVDVTGLSLAATAMLFTVAGRHTVRSNGQAVRVGLLQLQFNTNFHYSAVPKLVGRAFLKAEVVNPSEYPLLPGQGSVFVDNNFVATIAVPAVAPSEKFTVFLGADEGISVSCTSPKRMTATEGNLLTSRRTKVVMEYAIRVKNNKKTPVNIVIRDQIPVSENTQIVVELLEPNLRADPAGVKLDARGIVEWVLSPLAPGQKTVLKLKFSVEHPSGLTVFGM